MSYRISHIPGTTSLVTATIFPAIVIVIELVGGLCADSFFDPLPTIGHLMLVGLVPVINLMLWRRLQRDESVSSGLLIAGGAAVAISACYTLLFLPILPFAVIGILLIGIGLLPFTPVSGAVVLETDKDYDANGLPVPSPEDVPTVPEPETWALLAILVLAAGWLLRQQRQGMFA